MATALTAARSVTESYFGPSRPEEHFRLDPAFLAQYQGRKPPFGFNGLGEFVFYRTYSRLLPDGRKETFLDTLKRVVEGTYEIQRRYCQKIHVPWAPRKAQESAQEMFQLMWAFKFLPPGRGLWMMGTDFMWTRGSAALNNCFRGDTEIITRDGIRPIGELVGTTQTLLTRGGKWVQAPIRSFGKQEIWKLTLERSGVEKVVYTTAGHRWFARDRRLAKRLVGAAGATTTCRTNGYREFTTDGLRPGKHRLQYVFGQGIKGNVRPSPFGVAHGIAFGDGTTGQDAESCGTYLYLCGQKNEELLEYFPNCPATPDQSKGEEGAIRVADLPRFFRRPPSLRESKSYLYGWLAGYFAADGRINPKGNSPAITSSKLENVRLVRDVCAVLGIGTYAITTGYKKVRHKDGRVTRHLSHTINLMTSHLEPEFFLLEEHRRRFESWSSDRGERVVYHWRVKSVEPTGEMSEVFCPQVPETHSFALADNILTGNCGFVSTVDLGADPTEPFCFLMDMSMLGVGVGFDTKGANQLAIRPPGTGLRTHVVADSREGWVGSLRDLLASYTSDAGRGHVDFDYSEIRPAGSNIHGFGGKASGPSILMELHDLTRRLLDKRSGSSLSSVDIVDEMNLIGRCIVAGNVRRCLPKGTLVHLKRGLVPIEQVQVGDLVLTAYGYRPVAENVHQGVQRVITINTQMGPFRCTARHRVAVMTGVGRYGWKRAHQLRPGDRLVFVDDTIPGVETVLPGYSDSSRRGRPLVIPGLTAEVAWFLGAVHGDGYVYPGRGYRGRKHHGAAVTVPVNRDEYHDAIEAKIREGFSAFGFHRVGDQPSQDNCHRLRLISKRLAHYLHRHFKRAHTPLGVPECIRLARPAIRAAYLAGLLDSDGSTKNRPTTLVSSVYRDFLRQVQAVYSSLGIPTKLRLRKEADEAGQAKWELSLVGEFALDKFRDAIQPHAVKELRAATGASGHDFGYPSEWIDRREVDYGRSWTPQQDQMTHHRAVACGAAVNSLVPVEVYGVVDEGVECETHDLSVPDRSEFVAQGLLVHNTAEIAFGSPDDPDYCRMKNPTATLRPEDTEHWYRVTGELYEQKRTAATVQDFLEFDAGGAPRCPIPPERLGPAIETWNALNQHRWASNNSVLGRVGMRYDDVAGQIAVNGEPGIIYLENIQDYGRFIDGRQPGIDGRAMGSNPCFSGSMRLFTADGYRTLAQLWEEQGSNEYGQRPDKPLEFRYTNYGKHGKPAVGMQMVVNRNGLVSATNVYHTGRAELYRVTFNDGSAVEATANHNFIVWRRRRRRVEGSKRVYYTEDRVQLKDLEPGDLVPTNSYSHFGTHGDPDFGLTAGWCIGDGSLSPKADGQVRAQCNCYESDIEDVLPTLQDSLQRLYSRHNSSSQQHPQYAGWERVQEHFEHREEIVGSSVLGRLLGENGVVPGDKHRVPAIIWQSDRQTIAAFLKGLFSADGYANVSRNSLSIRLWSKSKSLLQECRLLLNQFGIASTVQKRSEAGQQLMNDGRGGKRLYSRAGGWELIVSGIKQCRFFLDEIGFIQGWKSRIAEAWLSVHHGSHNSDTGRYTRVVSIESIGVGPTFCLTEPTSNEVVVEGHRVGQCVEQSLESYELCCLVETFPANHDSPEDYARTLKYGYLYGKTVTLLPTHNARTNSVMQHNRRIGLSQSGIVQAFAKFGRRAVLEQFCDRGYREVRKWDKIYSKWLCCTESIKVTSVKPSGTISLVVGATPGIHYPEARSYWRRVRVARNSILVKIFADAGYEIEPAMSDPDRTVVIKFAVSEDRVRPTEEVTIWEQMANAADYQTYWADNQVSCTIKFQSHEAGQIRPVLEAFEDRLKGISFLPHTGHGYVQAPYEPCTREEVEAYNARLGVPDLTAYINEEAIGSAFCDSEACTIN